MCQNHLLLERSTAPSITTRNEVFRGLPAKTFLGRQVAYRLFRDSNSMWPASVSCGRQHQLVRLEIGSRPCGTKILPK
jgi:hypothetical protein